MCTFGRFGRFAGTGTEATHVRPLAVKAMNELGIDISGQESKTLDRYLGDTFDYVITVCDAANEACPNFPGAKQRLHWSFEDPAQATGGEEERLRVFQSVRDEIRERVEAELLAEDRCVSKNPHSRQPDE